MREQQLYYSADASGRMDGNVAAPVVNLNSGASAVTTVQVLSPNFAADGFYTVGIGASNYNLPSYAASSSANCAIYSSLAVSVSPGQSSYTLTQTASVTANVSVNGTPLSGANVTFTMTKSNGSRITTSAVSAANGSAVFSYKFNKKQDPTGTYVVNASVNSNGISGNRSTSFGVK